ncbi:flippase [Thermospira aquatica]|uniref:Flippase n=1 Tax=Thermospira aquatica TaxID=2828656 RepID=A0AAX3BER2_9SPIR|nr:flippase [Thermospira aquatica]URA10843.1 flippase [Thermospira aquatica]
MQRILVSLPVIGRFLASRPMLLRIVENIGWLSIDKFVRLVLAFFVNVWMVRYLGPTGYGSINYAVAFVSFFSIFVNLGMEGILVRELVKEPEKRESILGTAFVMRLMGSGVGILLALLVSFVVNRDDTQSTWFIFLLSIGFIFQSFLVIDFYFQSQINSKYVVFAQNIAVFVASGLRILLLLMKAPVVWFVGVIVLEGIVGAIFLVFFYLKNGLHVKHWRFEGERAVLLLKSCFPLMLSSIAVMIYLRIDQVMIRKMLGVAEVGLYSAAVNLSEVFYLLIPVIMNSVFPVFIQAKKESEESYYNKLQLSYAFMLGLGLGIAFLVIVFSRYFVPLLYGKEYMESISILNIQILAVSIVFWGATSSKWTIIENMQNLVFSRTLISALANVVLNFFLIPVWGGKGAAFATVCAQFISAIGVNLFDKRTRRITLIMLKSFFLLFNWKKLWLLWRQG